MNDRDLSLDYVKGFLVVSMVMYHTINYFTTSDYDVIKYLRFVTGSFIFISGYIVAVFYQKKYDLAKIKTSKRLLIRGFKIILIYTFLNIAINILGIQSHKTIQYNINDYLMSLGDIYIRGNSIYAVFQILVPIAYLLLLSPLLLFLKKWKVLIIILTAISLLAHVAFQISSFNLNGLLIGLFGLSVGLIDMNQVKYAIKHKTIILIIFSIIIFLMPFFDRNIISYSMAVLLIVKLVYDFSNTQDLTNHFSRLIIHLGQYSLLSYLMQIFFLQILYQLFIKQRFDLGYETLAIFLIANIFLVCLCLLVTSLRSRFTLFDKTYKLIFS